MNVSLTRYLSKIRPRSGHDNSQFSFLHSQLFFAEAVLNEDILWNNFAESGWIVDYLLYSAYKEDNHDYC